MTPEHDPDVTPAERVEDLPRILRAMRQAVQEALLRHKLLGQPVVVWRDGKVVWLQPDEIPLDVPEEPRSGD